MFLFSMRWDSMEHKDDLKLAELGCFSGTEQYHKVLNTNVTDGIKYIMDNGYSWLVTDSLITVMGTPKLSREEFISIKLKVADKKAIVTIEDGNNNILYTQKYDYTNAEIEELVLFLTDNVLMLSGEY